MTYAEVNPYPDWFNGLSPISAKKNIYKQLKKKYVWIRFRPLVSLYAAMSELVDISANESKLYDFLYHQNNSLIHVDLNLVMDALV